MNALRDFKPILSTLDARELLQATMVDLNLPSIECKEGRLFKGHLKPTGRPKFRVAVCVNRPKNLDPAVAFEMDKRALYRNEDGAYGTIAGTVKADFPIAFELGQPVPVKRTHPLSNATSSGSKPRAFACWINC